MVVDAQSHDTSTVEVVQKRKIDEYAIDLDVGDVAGEDQVGGSRAELTVPHVVGECSAGTGLLVLNDVNLTTISGEVCSLHSLEWLSLHSSWLTDLPAGLETLRQLEPLIISMNPSQKRRVVSRKMTENNPTLVVHS